jgi:hypothetical protein
VPFEAPAFFLQIDELVKLVAKDCMLKQRAGMGLLCHTYDEERAGKGAGAYGYLV